MRPDDDTIAFGYVVCREICSSLPNYFNGKLVILLCAFYEQVLLGSMAALSLMTIVSVVIGRIFQSVPAQFQTS